MTLVVENKNITPNFILFLKKKMLSYLATILNVKKLVPYDEYFKSDDFLLQTNGVIIDSKRVIIMSMSNLTHKRFETTTQIFVNPMMTYPGTNIKLVELCKIINYGTLSIDAYPIFSMTFNHFSRNLGMYIDRCIMGVG